MKLHKVKTQAFLLVLTATMLLSGCASDGQVSGYGSVYYGYGYGGYYDRDYYYRGDVIVRPPNNGRPKPEHPIHKPRPPAARPTPLPARPMPVTRPSRR
jgi:hypothetical protein